jgi:hypothetical protein
VLLSKVIQLIWSLYSLRHERKPKIVVDKPLR